MHIHTYHVPETIFTLNCDSLNLIFIAILWSKYYNYPHFTEIKTKKKTLSNSPRPHLSGWQTWGSSGYRLMFQISKLWNTTITTTTTASAIISTTRFILSWWDIKHILAWPHFILMITLSDGLRDLLKVTELASVSADNEVMSFWSQSPPSHALYKTVETGMCLAHHQAHIWQSPGSLSFFKEFSSCKH